MTKLEKICGIVSDVTGIAADAIAQDPASCQGAIDSLDLTEIIFEVEEAFDMIVEDEEHITNVAELIRCVEAQIA
ncbi:MAG: acyl carrier protein [Clostridiales bacterium]|nr:acyl carrier protein [Clostridiales bacterium]